MVLSIIRRIYYKIYGFLFKKGEIYYINGSELLPPPLSHEEEKRCLETLDTDTNSVALIIEHNLRLVAYIARRFENTGISFDDLTSIGTIGLIKAVKTYRLDKNIKFATYASRCIENEILMYIRKNNNRRVEVSIDAPLNRDWDGNELLLSDVLGTEEDSVYRDLESTEDNKILMDAISKLNSREQKIISLRFGLSGKEEMTQKEVADLLGISQSYISRLEKKIFSRIKKEIERKI